MKPRQPPTVRSFQTTSIPMKIITALTVFCLTSAAHLASAQDVEKTWIFLTDKLDGAGKTTQVEAGYISDRAAERRQRRGSSWSAAHDAPISPLYLNTLAAEGVEVVRRSRWLNAVSAYLDANQRHAVSQLPFVRRLQPVAGLTTDISPPTPMPPVIAHPLSRRLSCGESCAQLRLVNAITPLDNGINGQGVIVGFVDTRFDFNGVQLGHPATAHLANANRVKYRNYTADDPGVGTQLDGDFHGLSTTSVTLGNEPGTLIGPCHGADTVYVAHTGWSPLERNVEEDNFVAAVEWMEASGVDVINSSLGFATFDTLETEYEPSDMDGDTGVTTIAFDLAAQKGVVPVSSAGNVGNSPWRIITTPADGDSVIAVGAVDTVGVRAQFSSVGSTADGRTKPDVAAQGEYVVNAYSGGGFNFSNGTSFSAPMVTGIVCQILQVNPDLNPKEVWEVLTSTASQSTSPDNNLGWGIVNAQAAIDKAKMIGTAVADVSPMPSSFVVRQPYPNPFGDEAFFEMQLLRPLSDVQITVRNILGQRVLVPHVGPLSAGTHTITIQGQGLPAGLYTYVVEAGGETQTGLMVHVH